MNAEVMGSNLLLTHLSRSWRIAATRPSDLTSLFQLVLPEDLDKVFGNRRESPYSFEVRGAGYTNQHTQ
jgi:hypothetical protein